MAPSALVSTLVPASGVSHALFLPLTPATQHPLPVRAFAAGGPSPGGRVLSNLVLARGRRLRVFEVREEPSPTAASSGPSTVGATTVRLQHVLSQTVHGNITGLGALRTLGSKKDGLSRLVVSYEEAKMALLEWSDPTHSLITVSLHTYERTLRVAQADAHVYVPALRVDPESRAALLTLPGDAIAVLPIVSGHIADFEEELIGKVRKEVPYTPSFILEFPELDKRIQHVKDVCFLPGFNSTTIAVLYATVETWSSRLGQEQPPATISLYTLDVTSPTPVSSSTLISHTFLPFSAAGLVPCPVSLGGTVVLTPNALIHVDPSGNTVECAVNLYHRSEVPAGLEVRGQPNLGLRLEGARLVFLQHGAAHPEALLLLVDGSIRQVRFTKEGRQVKSITISDVETARGAAPSGVGAMAWRSTGEGGEDGTMLLLGSEVGEATLVKAWNGPKTAVVPSLLPPPVKTEGPGMDVDDDLYAPSEPAAGGGPLGLDKPLDQILSSMTSFLAASTSLAGKLRLDVCDRLGDHGNAVDLCFGIGESGQGINDPQLVTLGGAGASSSINFFYRDMPSVKRRRLDVLGTARNVWSLSVSSSASSSADKAVRDAVLVVDEDVESGHTKLLNLNARTQEPQVVRRIPAATIAVGELFDRSAIALVTKMHVSVLEADGRARQSIPAPDGARFVSASVSDPYVVAQRSDGTTTLFVGDAARGTLVEEMLSAGDGQAPCVQCSVFEDQSGLFAFRPDIKAPSTAAAATAMTVEEEDLALYGDDDEKVPGAKPQPTGPTASADGLSNVGKSSQWLCLTFADGRFEIRSPVTRELVFSARSLTSLPAVLEDERDLTPDEGLSSPDPAARVTIEQMLLAPIGRHAPVPHLLLLTTAGDLVTYEIVTSFTSSPASSTAPVPSLAVRFVKTGFRSMRLADGALPTPSSAPRLSPFRNLHGLTGVFLGGALPHWILREDATPVQMYSIDEQDVRAFAPSSFYGQSEEYILATGDGTHLVAVPPSISFNQPLPAKRVPTSRTYSHLVFDPPSRHLVAAGVFAIPFVIFDEDDNRIQVKQPDPKVLPLNERSSLELLDYDTCEIIDGYEFADNEVVLALASVNLQTKRTPLGFKDYIAVGTGISRGEDLSERGATYIFEIAEVVPDPARPQCRFGLKLLAREACKGAVTALTDLTGYLVSSMGQKIFVRAFDFEDRLVGLAFLEVNIYVTTLRTVKNLLLMGDAVRSVSLLAFQEDPFKLVPLGRDYRQQHIVSADFLIDGDEAAFVASDREGNLRVLEYNPAHIEAEGGQRLVHAAEYYHGTELSTTVMLARRTSERELTAPQSQLMLAGHDGSICTMIVVPGPIFKRLSLLQGQLLRSMQQFSGLNPRAYRTVPNDISARPLNRGVLDGDLLYNSFEALPLDKQREITAQIGTTVEAVTDDLEELRAIW